MSAKMSSGQVVTVLFQDHLRVAGSVVEGEVQLNFRTMQRSPYEEIQAKLLGTVFTKVTVSTTFYEDSFVLFRCRKTLWRRGEAYPPANTDILHLPFQLTLPADVLLPSCSFDNKIDRSGKVIYWIEIVALRADVKLSQRISRVFPVLPMSVPGAQLAASFISGWTGPWRHHRQEKPIRKGMWGEYAKATWTLALPDNTSYPVRTAIPMTLDVVTFSKPMKRDDSHTKGPIFPPPPHSPRLVELKLVRDVYVKARTFERTSCGILVEYLGGFAQDEDANTSLGKPRSLN